MNRRLLGCGFACVVAVGATAYAQDPRDSGAAGPAAAHGDPPPPNSARQLKRWGQSRSRAAS